MKAIRSAKQVPNIGLTELWLHFLWKEMRLKRSNLTTVDGSELHVEFPGWYNRCWGPDFKDARIRIGDDEYYGDIELHLNESAWFEHHHHLDEAYNRVILHVFINRHSKSPTNKFNQKVPALHLDFDRLRLDANVDLNKGNPMIRELPGACGLALRKDDYRRMKSIIFQAAENRIIQKSDAVLKDLNTQPNELYEDVLFRRIFRTVGYSAYEDTFSEMATILPYSSLLEFFRSFHRQKKNEVLARWLGMIGILDLVNSNSVHQDLRREWISMKQCWDAVSRGTVQIQTRPKTSSRPLNNPVRRLIGLYYHLEKVHFSGLLKSWLKLIIDWGDLIERDNRISSSAILSSLDDLFPQPDWEPFSWLLSANSRSSFESKRKLIGRQRQLVILVNAVIPFFLAWADKQHYDKIKKTLFALYLRLPAESHNRKTRFMEDRLFRLHPKIGVKKNLCYHQGLIQLHDDCCKNFYEGCRNCSLLKMLGK